MAQSLNELTTILFDLDGTLLDSRENIVDAAYETVQKYNPDSLTYQEVLDHFGLDLAHHLSKIIPDKEVVQRYFITKKRESYHRNPLFPYVSEGLKQLSNKGFRLGIVTNQQRDLVIKVLREKGMEDMFDVIVTKDDVPYIKPSPEPIKLTMEKLGVDTANVWMVGDTLFDLLAAKRAGVPCVRLNFYEDAELDASSSAAVNEPTIAEQAISPDYTFTTFKEFIDFTLAYRRSKQPVHDQNPDKEGVNLG
ncbi:HAD family hydrolase [Aquibacillus albus]|uniref:Pyrophosphatase PpaX n=1 Tax=Aquibacillus albus TaxID=1168171 RepID=A0ABS2MZN3_9BACI|nr:HAD-IIIA family hydrolase [Aquibacillus albus]MBM7571346.1 pyrophosphatase PpaX [Aquibacillus albus]